MLKSRIGRGIGANAFDKLLIAVIQVISVPVLSANWGLAVYGIWLMLSTVPSYLALADFGFASSAANQMTMQVARGEKSGALATFQAAWLAISAVSIAVFCAIALVTRFLSYSSLQGIETASLGHARVTVLLLVGYGLAILHGGVMLAGFRSNGNYALGTFAQTLVMLCENIAVLVIVAGGGGLTAAAGTLFAVRAIGVCILAGLLRAKAPWLIVAQWSSSLHIVRGILRPASAVVALSAAQAIFLQGSILVVGAAIGARNIPAFSTMRTLTRLGLQIVWVVNNAIAPEYTIASARADVRRTTGLMVAGFVASASILLPLSVVLLIAGGLIVSVWTRGLVHVEYSLTFVMVLTMLLNGAWWPLATILSSINKHSEFSYVYLILAIASVVLAYPLARLAGATGAATALVLLDGAMLLWTWHKAIRLGFVNRKNLASGALALRDRVNGNLARWT